MRNKQIQLNGTLLLLLDSGADEEGPSNFFSVKMICLVGFHSGQVREIEGAASPPVFL
jgi:hypothetical protein